MHCGSPNQNFGWAMAHQAHAAAPPPHGSINEYRQYAVGKGVRITSVGWQVVIPYDKRSHERIRVIANSRIDILTNKQINEQTEWRSSTAQ